jgi:hypothetical protein
MRTGRFVWRPTGPWRPVMYTNPDGPPKLDYVGLNYYSRCCRLLGLSYLQRQLSILQLLPAAS